MTNAFQEAAELRVCLSVYAACINSKQLAMHHAMTVVL